jgi:hypothetical protein
MEEKVKKSAIYRLEASTWELKRSQQRNKIVDNPLSLVRLRQRVHDTLLAQSQKQPKPTLSRKKRDFYQMKHRALLDQFRKELSHLSLLLSDGQSFIQQYYLIKYSMEMKQIVSFYSYELYLNTVYYKLYIRLNGYPKTLIDVLHDHTAPSHQSSQQIRNRHSEYLWKIFTNSIHIISGKYPQYHVEISENILEYDLFTQYLLLQYIEILFTKESHLTPAPHHHSSSSSSPPSVPVDHKNVICQYFLFSLRILQRLDELLRDYYDREDSSRQHQSSLSNLSHDTHSATLDLHLLVKDPKEEEPVSIDMISILLTQCYHTLRVLLMSKYQFRKNRTFPSLEYLKYNTEICEIFTRWIGIIAWNRQHPTGSRGRTGVSTAGGEAGRENEYSFPLAHGYTSFINHLLCDVFISSKCLLQIFVLDSNVTTIKRGLYSKDYGNAYQLLSNPFVESLESLSKIVLTNLSCYSEITRRISIGDIRVMESIQEEYVACLSCLTVIFSMGYLTNSLFDLLQLAKRIAMDFRSSMRIQSVWLQTLLSAILCLNITCTSSSDSAGNENAINLITARITEAKLLDLRNKINSKRNQPQQQSQPQSQSDEMTSSSSPAPPQSALESLPLTDQYYIFFGSLIHDLVRLLAYHITSPSIQHTGLLIIRLILRCPYLSKKEIEIFLEGNPLTQQEINEQKKLLKKELKDKFKATSTSTAKERVVIGGTTSEAAGGGTSGGENTHDGGEKLVDMNALLDVVDDDEISIESITEWKEKTWDDDNILLDDEEEQMLINDLGCTHHQIISHGQSGHGGLYYHSIPAATTATAAHNSSNKYDIIKKKKKAEAPTAGTGGGDGDGDGSHHTKSPETDSNSGGGAGGGNGVDKSHQFLYRTLQELTLSDLLKLVGESNMQSKETMEQWLLLVYHIANGTPLARQTLVNSYVDESLQKLLSIQVNDYYMIALCEMSLQILQHHDAD